MYWILLDWGRADTLEKLQICFDYCMLALDTPISMWGFQFSIAKVIYGLTALGLSSRFIKQTIKTLNRGSVD